MQKEQMKTLISLAISTITFFSRCECTKAHHGAVDHPGSAAAEAAPAPILSVLTDADLELSTSVLPQFNPLLSADSMSGNTQRILLSPLGL